MPYPLRLVAYKLKDSDDEYSWPIRGTQECFDHATPSHSEWQLVIYAEERAGSAGAPGSAVLDTPRAEEPIATIEEIKPNVDLSVVAAKRKDPATTCLLYTSDAADE